MKFTNGDILFFLCALGGLIAIPLLIAGSECHLFSGAEYMITAPFVIMIGIYSWQIGKRAKK